MSWVQRGNIRGPQGDPGPGIYTGPEPPEPRGDQLLWNRRIENWLAGDSSDFTNSIGTWTVEAGDDWAATIARGTTVYRSAPGALEIRPGPLYADGVRSSSASGAMPVVPGQRVSCSAWFRRSGGYPGSMEIWFSIEFLNAAGDRITTSAVYGLEQQMIETAWIQGSGTGVAPASAASARLYVQGQINSPAVLVMDDPVLSAGDLLMRWTGGDWTPVGTTGPAGGDLSGSYPNPTAAGLQGRPVAATAPARGQLLAWTGNTWSPAPSAMHVGTQAPDPRGGYLLWNKTTPPLAAITVAGVDYGGASLDRSLPAHQPGDLLVVICMLVSSTETINLPAPRDTVPQWQEAHRNGNGTGVKIVTAVATATSSNHTTGSWNGTTGAAFLVLRGNGPLRAGASSGSTGSSYVLNWPSLAPERVNRTSIVLRIAARQAGDYGGALTAGTAFSVVPVSEPRLRIFATAAPISRPVYALTEYGPSAATQAWQTVEIVCDPPLPPDVLMRWEDTGSQWIPADGPVAHVGPQAPEPRGDYVLWSNTEAAGPSDDIRAAGAARASADSVTLPPHQPGDMLVITARSPLGADPVIPSASGSVPAWQQIHDTQAAGGRVVTAYAIATGSGHTSGSWNGADLAGVVVLRGNRRLVIGNTEVRAVSGAAQHPALTPQRVNGSSIGLRIVTGLSAGAATLTTTPTAPAGWTQRSASGQAPISWCVSNTLLTSAVPGEALLASSLPVVCETIEIIADHSALLQWNGSAWAGTDDSLQGRPVSAEEPPPGAVLRWMPVAGDGLPPHAWLPADIDPGNADRLRGLEIAATAPSNAQVLAWNGTAWAPATPASIPASLPPSGSASGDLSGSYPGPVVSALRGRSVLNTAPSAGQLLAWNGSAWAPSTPAARAFYLGGASSTADATGGTGGAVGTIAGTSVTVTPSQPVLITVSARAGRTSGGTTPGASAGTLHLQRGGTDIASWRVRMPVSVQAGDVGEVDVAYSFRDSPPAGQQATYRLQWGNVIGSQSYCNGTIEIREDPA